MRFAIAAGNLTVAVLLALTAAPIPSPAYAESTAVVRHERWRKSPDVDRPRPVRTRPNRDRIDPLAITCAAASDLCGWRRIPGNPELRGGFRWRDR
jgi:hypothetical protein